MKTIVYKTKESGRGQDRSESTYIFHEDIDGIENEVLNIYPEVAFEQFENFGGAITDSAAYVYSQMNQEQKRQLMNTYFSADQMKYNLVRIHMDSCDFSTEMYEAMSDKNDEELKSFSFARTEKYIIPMLEDAQKAAGRQLRIMLSPWSPPAFMKSNHSRINGGSLLPEYYGMWAEYICKYIKEFTKRGYKVERLSLQNEAKAVQTWDSCVYTAAQEKTFLADYMYPALKEHGYNDVEIFIWDHNKERVFERVNEIVDEQTKDMVSGVAFHWYSGDHFEALDLVRKQYPNLKMIISESCIEYSKFGAQAEWENAARLSHEMIGDLNGGMTAFYDWNLLLDENGGPNHIGNFCHAPFIYDMKKKQLEGQLIQKHFYHFSHYIESGAKRIGFSRYTNDLEMTAFQNPNGTIVYVILNQTDKNIPVVLRLKKQFAKFVVDAKSICTGII